MQFRSASGYPRSPDGPVLTVVASPVETLNRTIAPAERSANPPRGMRRAHGVVEPFGKRLADRVVGAAILGAAAIPMLAIAAAIRATSQGPALFGQVRVGRGGAPFTMWKFRSMVADAEVRRCEVDHLDIHGGSLFKIPADPRVTPVGRWLRRLSLDELPQLINVVQGQMSLVGPRPPLPREVLTYDATTRRRLSVRPGLTGLWQISGRSDLSAEESIRLDLRYIDEWSYGLDLRILLRTARAVIRSDGAY